jgi:3-deoxy-manno-octulosonate cytidylyltransferase (CMP-KDO synthetase)
MSVVIVIPARYGSTRFPGKPLAPILGKTLLQRTWLIAKAVKGADSVLIATDDDRICQHALSFGAEVQMTPTNCTNGTERCLSALSLRKLRPEIVINLQGDAVLTPPAVIEPLIAALTTNPEIEIATPATRLSLDAYEKLAQQKASGQAGGTLVTFDSKGRALYFSKSIIPFVRDLKDCRDNRSPLPVFRHIGLYGYRFEALSRLAALSATPLEKAEGLEQLRALENGMHIQVVQVDYKGRTHWSVDSPEDAELVKNIILAEGELLAAV